MIISGNGFQITVRGPQSTAVSPHNGQWCGAWSWCERSDNQLIFIIMGIFIMVCSYWIGPQFASDLKHIPWFSWQIIVMYRKKIGHWLSSWHYTVASLSFLKLCCHLSNLPAAALCPFRKTELTHKLLTRSPHGCSDGHVQVSGLHSAWCHWLEDHFHISNPI